MTIPNGICPDCGGTIVPVLQCERCGAEHAAATADALQSDFLHYRDMLIVKLFGEGKTPDQIAKALSIDGDQVLLTYGRILRPLTK